MAFKFLKDRPRGTEKMATPASTLIAVGTPLKDNAGVVALATSGARVHYLAQGTKASTDSATTAIEIIPIKQVDVFIADIASGSAAMATTSIGTTCDLKSGATSTIDTSTDVHHDVELVGWDGSDTTKAYVRFNFLVPAVA